MEEFQSKIKSFVELSQYVFNDLFKKGVTIFVSLSLLLALEIGLISLIGLDSRLNITLSVMGAFFFLSLNFVVVSAIREEKLSKAFLAGLRIIIPVILLGGIVAEFYLLSEAFRVLIIVLSFLFFFWIVFASYISLKEKRRGMEAFIRALHLLKRNYLGALWKVILFFVVLFLASISLSFPFVLIHLFYGLPLWLIQVLGFIFLVFAFSLINIYLSLLCENVWKIRKHIAFSSPPPLYNLAIVIFLLVIFLVLVLASIAIG